MCILCILNTKVIVHYAPYSVYFFYVIVMHSMPPVYYWMVYCDPEM